jgi:uncharacterized small protein (DUF1192 family)
MTDIPSRAACLRVAGTNQLEFMALAVQLNAEECGAANAMVALRARVTALEQEIIRLRAALVTAEQERDAALGT